MKLPILDLDGISIVEQFAKVREELHDVGHAIADGTIQQKLEESSDLLQATLGLLIMISFNEEGLLDALNRHSIKMQGREVTGGLKIKKWITLQIKEWSEL